MKPIIRIFLSRGSYMVSYSFNEKSLFFCGDIKNIKEDFLKNKLLPTRRLFAENFTLKDLVVVLE